MSSVDPSGTSRPLRVAGVALLGGAVVAAGIGIATLSSGNSTPSAAGPLTSPSASSPVTTPSAAPSPSASPTLTTPPVVPPTTEAGQPGGSIEQPPSATPPAVMGGPGDGQSGGGQVAARPDVRVYNNSTVKGLAARAADDFRAAGWTVPEVGNYPSGVLSTTTVFFRPGTPEEAAAHELADSIQARAEPRFAGIQDARPGVIVIVTNDYKGYQSK